MTLHGPYPPIATANLEIDLEELAKRLLPLFIDKPEHLEALVNAIMPAISATRWRAAVQIRATELLREREGLTVPSDHPFNRTIAVPEVEHPFDTVLTRLYDRLAHLPSSGTTGDDAKLVRLTDVLVTVQKMREEVGQ